MKKILTITAVLVIMISSCMQTRYITEKQIKNNIENHKVNEFSTIRTYSVFKGTSSGGSSYLELTGYKYGNKKALIIAADKYYMARKKFQGDNTVIAEITYIELSMEQCKLILDNYKILIDRIKKEKPRVNEEIYHDFTISDELFISYKKSSGSSSGTYIYFWIKGESYKVSTNLIMKKLEKFINY
ncbi:MAG: hypothetical protein JXL97_00660 [Bacteroidales bacterium]|nr:hypothetical protein [Bacteroidales bacterium]